MNCRWPPDGPVAKTPPEKTSLEFDGRRVPVTLRRNPRARRIILRIDGQGDGGDGVAVTLPRGVSAAEGLALVREKADWVLERLSELGPRVTFADGAVVPLGGTDHLIRHVPGRRGVVRREGGEILVAGRIEHLGRRVRDWFRAQARSEIGPRVREKAARLGRAWGRVTIRDTKSRWGSCSADGNLSFCWRLVMAPETVLDYVVAHEVAHLAEANHGTKFWRLVDGLTADADGAREWLRENGEALHRYG